MNRRKKIIIIVPTAIVLNALHLIEMAHDSVLFFISNNKHNFSHKLSVCNVRSRIVKCTLVIINDEQLKIQINFAFENVVHGNNRVSCYDFFDKISLQFRTTNNTKIKISN